jgi:hypothetical protein
VTVRLRGSRASLGVRAAAGLAGALAGSGPARAELQDEIQVYLDDINAPGERGLELHVNTTPAGRAAPGYPGEVVSRHGTRVTAEFSYGLARDWEAGLYVPAVLDAAGRPNLAGGKLRLKWLPVHAAPESGGWFAGANVELSRVAARYDESRFGSELRLMAGRRTDTWILGLNPVFGWSLSDRPASATPDFSVAFKAARRVANGVAVGGEYHAGLGPVDRFVPGAEQDQRLYLTVDVDREPWVLNAGVGYGLTASADRWTVKFIFELPWGHPPAR